MIAPSPEILLIIAETAISLRQNQNEFKSFLVKEKDDETLQIIQSLMRKIETDWAILGKYLTAFPELNKFIVPYPVNENLQLEKA